jgi:hypothetical protein
VKTTLTGDPTAAALGMMPLFQQLTSFYRSHADLYRGAAQAAGAVSVSAPGLMTNLTTLADCSVALHLVNHNYAGGFVEQDGVAVTFPAPFEPGAVNVASPDSATDLQVPFQWSGGRVQVTVPRLVSYAAVVASPKPMHEPSRGKGCAPGRVAPVSR